VATEPARTSFVPRAQSRTRNIARFFPGTPPVPVAATILLALSLFLGLLAEGGSSWPSVVEYGLLVFFVPSVVAAAATPGLAAALGGKFTFPRGFLLGIVGLLIAVPFFVVFRVGLFLLPSDLLPTAVWVILLVQGPILWFRHLSLFGVSNPAHSRTLPASLLQPALSLALLFLLLQVPSAAELTGALAILVIAFLCALAVLRAADRPLRREFGVSGVGLIRPLLDHVASRDPWATQQLEAFFGSHTILADLRLTVLTFFRGSSPRATFALPSVHPGPFAAVGASDLPRKIDEALQGRAGTVFVPHTPCNHDLDLPSEQEMDRVRGALHVLVENARPSVRERVSPLVAPRAGSLARAQVLGDSVLVLVSQAPAPSDDFDFSVIDPLYHRSFAGETPLLAFIDAHNSYRNEQEGDLTYGSPAHKQLVRDVDAAVELALRSAVDGPMRTGVAVHSGYSVRNHGIGAEGVRALVIEGAGVRTAYVLIDGNNLLEGMRAPILAGLKGLVDEAEVMTTDNHVVHEVDGGINALGERYPVESLTRDVRAVVEEAVADLAPGAVGGSSVEIPAVRVLGPAWTARLLTSLGDTLSVFANAALTTFLLMVTSSLLVLAALQ